MDADRIERLTRDVIASYGLRCDVVTVTTGDGYWRIVVRQPDHRVFDLDIPVESTATRVRELLTQRLLAATDGPLA